MKITSSRPLRSTTVRATPRSSAAKGANFSSRLADEPAATGTVSSATPLGAIDGILAVQEVPTATDGRSRGIKHGYNILDHLDEIRLGLLSGSLSSMRLMELGREVEEVRETVIDPQLSAILDDIELRAAVELAKLEKSV
jgi:hypothetical protein